MLGSERDFMTQEVETQCILGHSILKKCRYAQILGNTMCLAFPVRFDALRANEFLEFNQKLSVLTHLIRNQTIFKPVGD
jgi:hypothetical protein